MGWGKIRDMAIAATQMVITQVFKDNGKNPETYFTKQNISIKNDIENYLYLFSRLALLIICQMYLCTWLT